MKRNQHIFSCIFTVVSMTTTCLHALPPGSPGFLISINDVQDFLKTVELPTETENDWLNTMAIRARGLFIAKIYSLAKLEGVNLDEVDEAVFENWVKKDLPTKLTLALYAFKKSTLADLVASILLAIRHGVTVEIHLTDAEFTSNSLSDAAGNFVYNILTLVKENPNAFTFNSKRVVKIVNLDALGKYKALEKPGSPDPFELAKLSYSDAVCAMAAPSKNASETELRKYISEGEKSLEQFMASIVACKPFENRILPVGETENTIIKEIQKGTYCMVTAAFSSIPVSLGDFVISAVPTVRIALAAQALERPSGSNILVTIGNPPLCYPQLGEGLPWMYVYSGLPKEGLQPRINICIGALDKAVLYSEAFRKTLHIIITTEPVNTLLSDTSKLAGDWKLGNKVFKYSSEGAIAPAVPGVQNPVFSLNHPIKVFQVNKPGTGLTEVFEPITFDNVPMAALEFVCQVSDMIPANFSAYHAIKNGVC